MADYAQYDLTEHDPYLLADSQCLINLVSCRDTAALNELERQVTLVSMASLVARPVNPTFDLSHLCEIHYRLFSRIYPFAGEIRQAEIGKGGQLFLPYTLIETEAKACFSALATEQNLKGLNPWEFGQRAGFYLGWINKIHAFREGNGRAQRIFIDQLAAPNNFYIEWAAMSDKAMGDASREARTIDETATALGRLISLNTIQAL